MQKILIVDDEEAARYGIRRALEGRTTRIFEAASAKSARSLIQEEQPQLMLVDINMPEEDGISLVKSLAELPFRPLAIMITAYSSAKVAVDAMKAGAYDYLTKPFSPREVILRIRAILRRGEKPEETLQAGPISIDPARHQVRVSGKRVHLTSLEFKLLRTLLQRRGRVQDRDKLLNDVWGYESVIDTRTVDTHVRRLREKLGKAGDAIETVRGFGYRLREK